LLLEAPKSAKFTLFNYLAPTLDELLLLADNYEFYFDRFEVLFASEHAHELSGLFGFHGAVL